MRLPARLPSLTRIRRRPGRGPLAVLLVLAGASTALGMDAGSTQRTLDSRSGPTVAAQSWSATAALVSERGRRGGAAYYRRTARNHVPPGDAARFVPLYREAERVYDVNWRLLASVHRQETAFSKAPSTYHGLNDFGCCAGPMQFNVTNGPVSTWKRYRGSFRDGRRPERYPHRTRSHPSIYDDFDAIMAAGSLLRDSGAGRALDGGAWLAAYSYYGHDLFSVTYASQVLARAEAWQRHGFCPNCELDEALVAEFDDAYGASIRRELTGDERPRKKRKRRKRQRAEKRDREERKGHRKRRDGDSRKHPSRSPARVRRPTGPPSPRKERPTAVPPAPTAPTQPAAPAPSPAPPPPAGECPPIRKLLGC